jgi:hypothetical protein
MVGKEEFSNMPLIFLNVYMYIIFIYLFIVHNDKVKFVDIIN